MDHLNRILFVEDDQNDVELNIREIKKAIPQFDYQVVFEQATFIESLNYFMPDIIVSDYNMPAFDGLTALKIAQENYPLTPFIIVTGSVNEDTAVVCMKAGATDYVLKDSLKRLGSSVLNALKQKKIKEERIEAYKTIKQNEAKYRYLFHNNPQPMLIYDADDFRFLEVNEAAVRHYGYTQAEFLEMKLTDILTESGKNKLAEKLHVIHADLNAAGEWIHRKKNNELIFVEIVSHSIIFNDRKARHALINDITNRKKIEEGLQREKKLLRTLIDSLPDSIYIKDEHGRKVIANAFDSKMTGFSTGNSTFLGKTDLEIFGEERGKQSYTDDQKVLQTGIPIINKEEVFIEPSGTPKWLLTSKVPIVDTDGKIAGLVGIGRNITEQKQAQEKILKLSKGIEQSPVSIEITDANGIIEYVNPHFCTTTGYSSEEVIGKHARILRSETMPEDTYADLWPTIRSGGIWQKELINKKKDGSLYWEAVTITSIKNEKGAITNYIAIKQNISERKQMEAELIKAKEKAEESDRLKSAFLANMSHEIRTPLNSIIGFSELLNDDAFDDNQKSEFVTTIIENGNNLLSIISDIMDFSMLEAQQIKIREEKFQIRKLLDDIFIDFRKKAKEKSIELKMNITNELKDTFIISDLYRIKQILINLTGNAIKFTSQGFVEIGCYQDNQFVVFHVKDSGIGIPAEFHHSIFERFRQVDLAKNRKYGGNGLGLSISKNLVELMGGKIWVESEPDKYSHFFFSIPFKKK